MPDAAMEYAEGCNLYPMEAKSLAEHGGETVDFLWKS